MLSWMQAARASPSKGSAQQVALAQVQARPQRPSSAPQARSLPVRACSAASLERSAGVASTSTSGRSSAPATPPAQQQSLPHLTYEVVKGTLVRYSSGNASDPGRHPPTAVLVHGILGSRRNMQSFARRLVDGFPNWQVMLVDLRCHGESAGLSGALPGPHGVGSAAEDITRLLASLRMFPELLIGHSFGGKVVMSIAQQFSQRATSLPRPVKVWVLDALPGEVRSGEMGAQDRPADLITSLQSIQLPVSSRPALVAFLEARGFSTGVAAWAATNLVPAPGGGPGLVWGFDLPGIAQMYKSYESTSLWPLLSQPLAGLQVSFVKAQHSTFRWAGGDEARIRSLGHAVHELPNSGHWVHTDNPDGLFDILAPSFGSPPDLRMRRSSRDGASTSPLGGGGSPPASPRSNITPLGASAAKQLAGLMY